MTSIRSESSLINIREFIPECFPSPFLEKSKGLRASQVWGNLEQILHRQLNTKNSLYRNPDDLIAVVSLVHHPEEGAEQEDEDQVESEGEEEQPAGPKPFLLNESRYDWMTQDWTGSLPGQIHQVLHKNQTSRVLIHKALVVDDNREVVIINIIAGSGDAAVELGQDDLVPVSDCEGSIKSPPECDN